MQIRNGLLLAVPIGAFGAIFTLILLPGISNNVYAQIGLITLIGLAAKNAILIVEFAKVRVDRGEEFIKSTLEAVKLRLRPIIMTSLAFILGVLPLVFAIAGGCAVGPDFKAPAAPTPERYTAQMIHRLLRRPYLMPQVLLPHAAAVVLGLALFIAAALNAPGLADLPL